MSAKIGSNKGDVATRDESYDSYHPDTLASGKKDAAEHLVPSLFVPLPDAADMKKRLLRLWADREGPAYDSIRRELLESYLRSSRTYNIFQVQAISLLTEFQMRNTESIEDSLEWSKHVDRSGIDSKRYFEWVRQQYRWLAYEKHDDFDDVPLERFIECLSQADWKHSNDDSAVVNSYLLHSDISGKPEFFLGRLNDYDMALRLNGKCLTPPDAIIETAMSHGVTSINPNILLSLRYMSKSTGGNEGFLFIPLGDVFRRTYPAIWKTTSFVIVLSISDDGQPNGLHLVRDLMLLKADGSEGDTSLKLKSDPDSFTLGKITNLDHRDLQPGKSTGRLLELQELTSAVVEIVQTGVKGDWSEGDPPIGLYPVMQNWQGS